MLHVVKSILEGICIGCHHIGLEFVPATDNSLAEEVFAQLQTVRDIEHSISTIRRSKVFRYS